MKLSILALLWLPASTLAFVPLLDGGKDIPALSGSAYKSFFNDQIAKQAKTAVANAVGKGITKIEVNFPPVPNLDEVRFGTPLNQKFGKSIVAKDLGVAGGYTPGSYVSRNLAQYSNMYWAKKIAPALGGFGKDVHVLTAEQVKFDEIRNSGVKSMGSLRSTGTKKGALIAVNPGGEETWERIRASQGSPSPFLILNNAYSTTYELGNKQDYEEVYYLKRISKGWVFRAFPGPWKAYLEKPNGSCELLQSYKEKPNLNDVAALVRDESFKRYAILNDRFSKGFGERL